MTKSTTRTFLEKFNLGVYRPFPRSAIKFIRENLGEGLVGVEIGVLAADHAKTIMETLDIKTLYLIDRYREYHDYNSRILNRAKKKAEKRMAPYGDRARFVIADSMDALRVLPDNLDFVYIDGDHRYESVRRDMEEYYKKIRNGGILCGHDIQNGFCPTHDGVTEAFIDFVKDKNLKPHIWIPDWWVVKGGTR